MNSFAVLDASARNPTPVIPEFRKRDEQEDKNLYLLVGFASPLTDGARRGSRAISGDTPLYATRSHQNVWQMQTKVLVAKVKTPYMGVLKFFGCEVPCVIFRSAEHDNVEYGVQNPDGRYKQFWDATIAVWAVEHALGNEQMLKPWVDVDPAQPRPWYFNNWAMRVLRYEHGLPVTHPSDPERRAMLGACRRAGRAAERREPKTEEEWLAIPSDQCDSGDDEEGSSDAGSINDDVRTGLPTSSQWDPKTKKSISPRGNEPHPYPQVVQQELERNRMYEQQESTGGVRRRKSAVVARTARKRVRGGDAGPAGAHQGGFTAVAAYQGRPADEAEAASAHSSDMDVEPGLPQRASREAHPEGEDPTEPEASRTATDAPPASSGSARLPPDASSNVVADGAAPPVGYTSSEAPSPGYPGPVPPVTKSAARGPAPGNRPTPLLSAPPARRSSRGVAPNATGVLAYHPPGQVEGAPARSTPRGTGPPRRFVVPPPGAPTVRSGPRGGPRSGREQARGFSVEPE
ncbi:hypothetical protein FRC08_006885 [Ceratobasidium sp. 394]|nr:hypothetical protein FRC08_006885 [Ceratobasidium sp. 394]KAG9100098.1 hypothetical protein FS749_016288 [Ceratobasidium sp. UAMH 11750]